MPMIEYDGQQVRVRSYIYRCKDCQLQFASKKKKGECADLLCARCGCTTLYDRTRIEYRQAQKRKAVGETCFCNNYPWMHRKTLRRCKCNELEKYRTPLTEEEKIEYTYLTKSYVLHEGKWLPNKKAPRPNKAESLPRIDTTKKMAPLPEGKLEEIKANRERKAAKELVKKEVKKIPP